VTVLVRLIDTEKFGELLDERQLTRRDLSRITGLSKTLINYLANGERNPSLMTAEILAGALGVPMDQFIVERWVPRPHTPPHGCPAPAATPDSCTPEA
jgi:transcriptional regulator with XRE-family HTH domain